MIKLNFSFKLIAFFVAILGLTNFMAALKLSIYPEGNDSCYRVAVLLAINFVVFIIAAFLIGSSFGG